MLGTYSAFYVQYQSNEDAVMNPEGEEFVATSDDGEDSIVRQVVVGICAMEKKSASKPMREILTRLEEFEYLKTAIFPEEVILNVSSQISMSISRRDLTFFSFFLLYRSFTGAC